MSVIAPSDRVLMVLIQQERRWLPPLGTSFSPTASFPTPSPAHLFNTLQRAFDSGGRRIYATIAGAIQPGSKQCLGLETAIKRIEKRINQE
jgi:hypothetical protein